MQSGSSIILNSHVNEFTKLWRTKDKFYEFRLFARYSRVQARPAICFAVGGIWTMFKKLSSNTNMASGCSSTKERVASFI